MKRYILLSLFAFSSATLSGHAGESEKHTMYENKAFNLKLGAQSQNVPFHRYESALEFFDKAEKGYPVLQIINKQYNFTSFAYRILMTEPLISDRWIVAKFIGGAATAIRASDDYSYKNLPLFNLVEILDPIYRVFAGMPQHTPLLPCVQRK